MSTPTERTAHPFFTYEEMHAQPAAMRAVLVADSEQRDHIARELAGTHHLTDVIVGPGFPLPTFVGRGSVYLVGCGTAHHAALTGAEWFRQLCQGVLSVKAAQAFEFTHYGRGGPRTHDAFLALSHSGTASATVAAAAQAKNEGMYTVAISGTAQSPLVDICDELAQTMTTPTVAATYTISHLTMLTMLADLAQRSAEQLRETRSVAAEVSAVIASFPDLAAAALAQEDAIKTIVDSLTTINQVIFAGGGLNWYTAIEGALKVREASYLPAMGFEMEEMLHGPFSSFDENTAAVLIAPQGPARDRACDVLRALQQIGVITIAFGSAGDEEMAALATHFVALPASPEIFSPIPATVYVQELAYWLAMQRGSNPDRIRRNDPRWAAARQAYTR